jgi:thymidylate synthase ThyX
MSADEYLEGETLEQFREDIYFLHEAMVDEVDKLATKYNIHKQTLNRYLEPWLMTTMLVSSTEWDNWFNLRLNHKAQPEIQELAEKMAHARAMSTPEKVLPGHWHIPFEDFGDHRALDIAVARCARVSYETHAGVRDREEDIRLFEQLKADKHMSPFEHVACARAQEGYYLYPEANFKGWTQYRAFVEAGE